MPICPLSMRSPGAIWEAKTAPKSIPKRSKIEAKNQDEKKPIQNDLGPVLGRSWAVLGAILGPWKRSKHYACRCFVRNHFFDVKTVRRRSWDQLWPTKAPKRPKMTPKTEPKSTPRRSKIDVKIDIKNDAKSKRAHPLLGRRHWAGTPPREPPQGPRGGGPGPMGLLKSHRLSKKGSRILESIKEGF